MNACATSVMAPAPPARAPLTLSEPFGAKNAAPRSSRLHHAAVYRLANLATVQSSSIIRISRAKSFPAKSDLLLEHV